MDIGLLSHIVGLFWVKDVHAARQYGPLGCKVGLTLTVL